MVNIQQGTCRYQGRKADAALIYCGATVQDEHVCSDWLPM